MKLLRFSQDSRGSAMIQVMAAGAVLLGLSAYVINTQMSQEKLGKTVGTKTLQSVLRREISEAMTIPEVCSFTFGGTLTPTSMSVSKIRSADGTDMYEVGKQYYGKNIHSITLLGYQSTGAMKLSHLDLQIEVDREDFASVGVSQKKLDTAFESKNYITRFTIPLDMVTTPDDKVRICGSNSNGSMEALYKKACENVGGIFNPVSGVCDNLHGQTGALLTFIRQNLCSAGGGGCQHPYALQQCNGVDVRGANWNNWALTGFTPAGTLMCGCLPIACGNPANFCSGVDLGTNHCSVDCGTGTKTIDECAPPPPSCTAWSPWVPDTSSVCSGTALTQSRNCTAGGTFTDTQGAMGTKTDGACVSSPTPCTVWGAWAPDPSSTCVGMNVSQSRSCDNGDSETQNVNGTMTGSTCCSSWGAWAPDASSECTGSNVAQTRSCTDGTNTSTDSRNIPGTKADPTCCTSWSDWSPETSVACVGVNVPQTRSCTDGNSAATDTRNSPGSKNDASCCTSWTDWSPDPANSCSDVNVAQVRNCNDGSSSAIDTRVIPGSKSGGTCCSAWSEWAPAASGVCSTQTLSQTRTCTDGANSGTDTRTVQGEMGGEACCSAWSSWAPDAGTICSDQTVGQTQTCLSPVGGGTKTQTVQGTKACEPPCLAAGTLSSSAFEQLLLNGSQSGCTCEFESTSLIPIQSPRSNKQCCSGTESGTVIGYTEIGLEGSAAAAAAECVSIRDLGGVDSCEVSDYGYQKDWEFRCN